MRNSAPDLTRVAGILLAALALLSPGCAPRNLPEAHASFRYFERPGPYDTWSFKISQWQSRQQAETEAGPLEAAGGTLRNRYLQRRSKLRRELAQQVASWIQEEAKLYYAEDMLIDHWPTLGEVLVAEADDCDGLELLVQQLLLDLGFPGDQVYRAVVRRPSDDQHHMVTLWFESPEDPWVIDPTGAMVLGLRRMSDVPEWVPLKLFTSTEEFTVRQAFRTP